MNALNFVIRGYSAQIKFIPSNPLTLKIDIKKNKGNWKKEMVAFVIPKTIFKCKPYKLS